MMITQLENNWIEKVYGCFGLLAEKITKDEEAKSFAEEIASHLKEIINLFKKFKKGIAPASLDKQINRDSEVWLKENDQLKAHIQALIKKVNHMEKN